MSKDLEKALKLAQEQLKELNLAYFKLASGLDPTPHFNRIDEIHRIVDNLLKE